MRQTRALDRMAANGIFSTAYTPCPICVTARASFATGQHVHEIKLWDNSQSYAGSIPRCAQYLRGAGRPVKAIGKMHYRKFEDSLGYDRVALNQYHAFASPTGSFMIRRGRYKYHYNVGYLPELFDLNGDPKELHDPADDPRLAETLRDMNQCFAPASVRKKWTPSLKPRRLRSSSVMAIPKKRRMSARWERPPCRITVSSNRRYSLSGSKSSGGIAINRLQGRRSIRFLPMRLRHHRSRPPSRRVPITTRSASKSRAAFSISSTGSP